MVDGSRIPAFDYLRDLATYRDEIDSALSRVLDSGCLILGSELQAFEVEFAQLVDVAHAVGVASGTDALILALRAVGVGAGDRVITVANTAVPTVSAIRATGAAPLFVDVDPETLQMSVEQLRTVLQSPGLHNVRCILPVHLHGQAADMEAINALSTSYGIPVVADCAQAHGTEINGRSIAGMAAISCYSFYPTKNLAAFGDGGMCVTESDDLQQALRELRQYGFRGDRVAHREGVCSRLDEIQAAALRVRLKYFRAAQQARHRIAERYLAGLADCPVAVPPVTPHTTHAWHQFVIRTQRRPDLCATLDQAGIGYGIHYPVPIHLMPAYAPLGYALGDLPHTERAAAQILSLPMFPALRETEVERVLATVRNASSRW